MLLATAMFGGSVVAVEPIVVTRAEQTQAAPAGGPVQDSMSAQRTARLRGAPVEVVGERTETSTTWANRVPPLQLVRWIGVDLLQRHRTGAELVGHTEQRALGPDQGG
jgi:hypothetical protein